MSLWEGAGDPQDCGGRKRLLVGATVEGKGTGGGAGSRLGRDVEHHRALGKAVTDAQGKFSPHTSSKGAVIFRGEFICLSKEDQAKRSGAAFPGQGAGLCAAER